jgi:hypothetical protein
MEAKYGTDPEHLRNVFEKALSLTLKQNSIKLLFKKFLEFEQRLGEPGREEYVKKRAAEYVAGLLRRKGGEEEGEEEDGEAQ